MEGVTAFGAAFAVVALLELGDKTQLLVISLATRHAALPIAAGAFLGETARDHNDPATHERVR